MSSRLRVPIPDAGAASSREEQKSKRLGALSSAVIARFPLPSTGRAVRVSGMPDYAIGTTHTLPNLAKAYKADPQGSADGSFLLHRGEEILALCLRQKLNPRPGEVWIGAEPAAVQWGERLAGLKGKRAVPVYFLPRGRTLYEFRGDHLITGDTTEANELAERKSPAPLSRVVYIKAIAGPKHQ